jgi:hypothetical protein
MTNATLKQEVLAKIEQADVHTLKILNAILDTNAQYDFWDDLPDSVKQDVEAAIKESDLGLGKPHQEIMLKYKKWLSK